MDNIAEYDGGECGEKNTYTRPQQNGNYAQEQRIKINILP